VNPTTLLHLIASLYEQLLAAKEQITALQARIHELEDKG
jgi:hypothetical protein